MPTLDALKVVWRTTRDRSTLDLHLAPMARRIRVRANTSDLHCLEKVFIDEEYKLPSHINPEFDITPKLIVDAGANIGMASLYFARAFPDAQIFAIEPEESNFQMLLENCREPDHIIMKNAALWPSMTTLQLVDPTADKWSFSVRPALDKSSTVESITIPQILDQSGLDRIDILKIDIEGAEKELFSDSCESWLSKVGMIVIELHDRFKPGCSETFYSHIVRRSFVQEIVGENIFLRF
jgi:FkbM family methyltransferase